MRREFSAKVMLAAYERAAGSCEGCGLPLHVGRFHYDHILPDALGGTPTLDNCQVLCVACHGKKTAGTDVPRIAKAKRVRAKHLGIRKPSSFRGWRRFDGTPVRNPRA
jgi:5-methylcytosine-specific restriction endonuclease McrA